MGDAGSLCHFCKRKAEYIRTNRAIPFVTCSICGDYYVPRFSHSVIKAIKDIDRFLLNCIAESIKANSELRIPFWLSSRTDAQPDLKSEDFKDVVIKYLDDYTDLPVDHAYKPEKILTLLASKISKGHPFYAEGITIKEMYSLKIQDERELDVWTRTLIERSYLKEPQIVIWDGDQASPDRIASASYYSILPAGWAKIEELRTNVGSRKAFIAMSFQNPERKKLQEAIEGACRETGWEGAPIDKSEYLGGVMDEIISKINQSRFIIAEFTGNRAGVYYEAGYAEGRGIPVIYAIKKGEKEPHFDTRHLNHIEWETFDELKQKLINRIGAVINR